jgi:hypothetical protein
VLLPRRCGRPCIAAPTSRRTFLVRRVYGLGFTGCNKLDALICECHNRQDRPEFGHFSLALKLSSPALPAQVLLYPLPEALEAFSRTALNLRRTTVQSHRQDILQGYAYIH